MTRSRGAWAAAILLVVAVAAGAWTFARGGVEQAVVKRKVREVAVGTWRCRVTYDGEVEWRRVVGITADGRLGMGTQIALVEAGRWTIEGRRVELTVPLRYAGQTLPIRLTYTGDADPPTEVEVHDSSSGDTGHFDVSLDADRLIATQQLTDRAGEHQKRITCDKTSDVEPTVARPR